MLPKATFSCRFANNLLGFVSKERNGSKASMNLTRHALSSTPASSESSPVQENTEQYSGVPPLVVFGGNGFVGSHICQEAIRCGLPVKSISRSGRPAGESAAWADQVEWVTGDALNSSTFKEHLTSCLGVISCIGLISASQEDMKKINGQANVQIIQTAKEAGVQRLAYISAHEYNFPGDLIVMKGYFEGKREAEACIKSNFPEGGVILRPGFIHGVRKWGSTSIPLSAVGVPLEAALKLLPTQSLAAVPVAGAAFVPPVSAQKLAKAAVRAATDPSVAAGVVDVWEIGNA